MIEAKSVVVNEDGSEEEVLVKKTMEEFEFDSGRLNLKILFVQIVVKAFGLKKHPTGRLFFVSTLQGKV